jgi:hypothetical protein
MKTEIRFDAKRGCKLGAALLLSAFCFLLSAFGQLTTVVYPGYTLQPGERITIDKLNLLGSPTVVVSGTSTGSVIAAGSITSSSITTNAFDQLTILGGYNGTTASAIRVNYNTNDFYLFSTGLGYKTNSIADIDIATNAAIAWSKLALSTNIIPQTNLPLSLNSNILHGTGTNGTPVAVTVGNGLILSNNTMSVSNSLFTTAEYSIATGQLVNTNHGLGATPTFVRWVLVCKTNDLGYAAGDEVPAMQFTASGYPVFSEGGNSTNIFLGCERTTPTTVTKSGSDLNTAVTIVRWRVKGYAKP